MKKLKIKKLRRFLYSKNKFIFYEVHLNNLKRDWKPSGEIYFEHYKSADARLLENIIKRTDVPAGFTIEEVDQRITDGHRFYVAKKNGGIIGYVWYAVNEYYSQFFNGTIYLKPDEVFALNAYVQKEFRGLGVLNCLRAYAYDELKKSGYERVMTYINSANRAAERMHTKFGSVPIGVLYYIIILTSLNILFI